MADFITHFSRIEDPHIERCKKHKLLDILFLTVAAVLSGAQGREDIEEFGHSRLEWARRIIGLSDGVPRLLELFEIMKCIITIDAMGCQKSIASEIIKKKGDYVLGVKKNQPALHNDCVHYFENYLNKNSKLSSRIGTFETRDKAHGRIEIRRCWQSTDLKWLIATKEWKGTQSVLRIESERQTSIGTSLQVRYFVTSLSLNPEKALSAVRQHWFVENQLHLVLDVTFGEDAVIFGEEMQQKTWLSCDDYLLISVNAMRTVTVIQKN